MRAIQDPTPSTVPGDPMELIQNMTNIANTTSSTIQFGQLFAFTNPFRALYGSVTTA